MKDRERQTFIAGQYLLSELDALAESGEVPNQAVLCAQLDLASQKNRIAIRKSNQELEQVSTSIVAISRLLTHEEPEEIANNGEDPEMVSPLRRRRVAECRAEIDILSLVIEAIFRKKMKNNLRGMEWPLWFRNRRRLAKARFYIRRLRLAVIRYRIGLRVDTAPTLRTLASLFAKDSSLNIG